MVYERAIIDDYGTLNADQAADTAEAIYSISSGQDVDAHERIVQEVYAWLLAREFSMGDVLNIPALADEWQDRQAVIA